jgi:hypothetical protein
VRSLVTRFRNDLSARSSSHPGVVPAAMATTVVAEIGGQIILPEDRQTWPKPGDRELRRIEEVHTLDLWDNFALMILLCGLLGLDWLLRLVRGYV